MKVHSLTRALTGGVLFANLLCCVSFSIVATLHEMHGRRRAFDVLLRGRADSLLSEVRGPNGNDASISLQQGDLIESKEDVFEIFGRSGKVLVNSQKDSPQLQDIVAGFKHTGYLDFILYGKSYRGLKMPVRASVSTESMTAGIFYAAPTGDLHHEAVEAAAFYAKASAVLLLCIACLLIWFLRSRLFPLKELAVRAGRVNTNSWDFDPPERALHTIELRPIAVAMRKLLHGLRLAFERQRQFTGDAAHELKTSIAVLKSSLQLLSMRSRSAAEYEKGIAGLSVDIQRMEELTEQMLTLARVEEEDAKHNETTDMSETLRNVTRLLHGIACLRDITICKNAENPQIVAMHPADADVLCTNLIKNAIQHSPTHSMLMVSVAASEGRVELRVADCGDGIPAAALPRIFERFYRADSSRSRNSGGTGLGLAICKAIVERCGGDISITSDVGRGTEVLVSLPVGTDSVSLKQATSS